MINGYIENLELPWEERLGDEVKQLEKGLVENFVLKKERKDENTLIVTAIEEVKPRFVDTYITDDLGRLQTQLNQDYDGSSPCITMKYKFLNEKSYITQIEEEGNTKFVMVITKKNNDGNVMEAEYRFLQTGNLMCNIYVKRDFEDNIREEIILGVSTKKKGIIKSDEKGRWLSYEEFVGDELIWMRKYSR